MNLDKSPSFTERQENEQRKTCPMSKTHRLQSTFRDDHATACQRLNLALSRITSTTDEISLDDKNFEKLKDKFNKADRNNESEIILLVQELLEMAFKPSAKYTTAAIEMVLKLPLNKYAKYLVKLYKNNATKECFTKKFFQYLGQFSNDHSIQKTILNLMLKLTEDYRGSGQRLTLIWFRSSPLRSMFLHIDETGYETFLKTFNKVVKYRQENPANVAI